MVITTRIGRGLDHIDAHLFWRVAWKVHPAAIISAMIKLGVGLDVRANRGARTAEPDDQTLDVRNRAVRNAKCRDSPARAQY
jgi:hypothetical protein